MTVTVMLFAALADAVGRRQLTLELPAGATVNDAVAHLAEAQPALSAWRGKLTPAVNLEYTGMDHVLRDGDELALIGPVSGG